MRPEVELLANDPADRPVSTAFLRPPLGGGIGNGPAGGASVCHRWRAGGKHVFARCRDRKSSSSNPSRPNPSPPPAPTPPLPIPEIIRLDVKITRALISLSDKTGLLPFARALAREMGVEILSTGGTAKALRDAGHSRSRTWRTTRGFRDFHRPRQDAAPARPRRPALPARRCRARAAGPRKRHPAHRPARGQSVPVPRDRRQTGRDAGGSH